MPMRAYRASTAHVANNLPLWILITGVATVVLAVARYLVGGGDHLGDLTAIVAMVFGTMIMLKSQQGFVPAQQEPEVA